jgi:hypothetical protein
VVWRCTGVGDGCGVDGGVGVGGIGGGVGVGGNSGLRDDRWKNEDIQ